MATRADLPVYVIGTTTAHIDDDGVYVYFGSSPATGWLMPQALPTRRRTGAGIIIVKVRETAAPVTLTRNAADLFMTAGGSATTFVVQPGESVWFYHDGQYWQPLFGPPASFNARVVTSSAATLTLGRSGLVYVNTGAASTWTLPAVANNTGLTFIIQNRGSGAVTLQRAGSDNLYDTTTQTSVSIPAGAVMRVVNDGTYWLIAGSTDPQYDVNTVGTSGTTQTLPATSAAHRVTLSANCTFTFSSPTKAGHTFVLYLSGAFTPTFPASVKWDGGAAPTYTSPALYTFTTVDSGTTWIGAQVAKAIA